MPEIAETALPGVGVRHEFVTKNGERIGVITHHTGRRELLIYDREDPDACREDLRLDEEETRALADLLGGSSVVRRVENIQQSVEGLTIDWLPVGGDAVCAGHTIGETELRRRTGVTIVAIVRGGATTPAPDPDQRIEQGDTLVVVGTPDGIRRAAERLGVA